jgi:class 3 adenylate cyclase
MNEPLADLGSARRALAAGEPLLAYDACATALESYPSHAGLRQLQALALARAGAADQALKILQSLHEEGARDEETLGLLARVHKDLWESSGSPAHLAGARQWYESAHCVSGGYWSAINAATLAAAAGELASARRYAAAAQAQCLQAMDKGGATQPWLLATLGEAALLLEGADAAGAWYARALAAGAGYGDRASMRRNARILLHALELDPAWLEQQLPGPAVGIFTAARGRALPGREPSASLAAAIGSQLQASDVRIGYASAGTLEELLFHESMLALGRETHVVLPEAAERFLARCVATGGEPLEARLRSVLQRANSVIVHSASATGELSELYNSWMVLGLARLRARQLEGRVHACAVADESESAPAAVADWRDFGQAVQVLARGATPEGVPAWRAQPALRSNITAARRLGSQRIVSMIFADAVGFSRLADDAVPAFVEHFLGKVAAVLDTQREQPLTRNTWGDGLYFSFSTLRAAGCFALELADALRAADWRVHGLPGELSLRIALHCGPAHEVVDPILRQRNYTGAHVSRAARLEPVTPPGNVYASEPFAALCECDGVREFVCEYVGRMPLAKKYGDYRAYRVRWSRRG